MNRLGARAFLSLLSGLAIVACLLYFVASSFVNATQSAQNIRDGALVIRPAHFTLVCSLCILMIALMPGLHLLYGLLAEWKKSGYTHCPAMNGLLVTRIVVAAALPALVFGFMSSLLASKIVLDDANIEFRTGSGHAEMKIVNIRQVSLRLEGYRQILELDTTDTGMRMDLLLFEQRHRQMILETIIRKNKMALRYVKGSTVYIWQTVHAPDSPKKHPVPPPGEQR